MTHFIKNGNTFNLVNEESLDIHPVLPAGNYIVQKNERTGMLYLESIESFTISGKVYGDTLKNTNRIINTYLDRTASTGVLLVGEKGSGKTLLSKSISIECAKQGIPTIVINFPWVGDNFNKLIQDINQPCVVVFDEFEKVYDKEQQESILTLLDGVYPSKKLFILTCNDKYRIDSHMKNRPGRIYYLMEFDGLEESFIKEYCEDTVKDKSQVDAMCKISNVFAKFNFDMLKAVVEEMNRYDETPQQALKVINARPEFDFDYSYIAKIRLADLKATKELITVDKWRGNPLNPKYLEFYVTYEQSSGGKDEDDGGKYYNFSGNDLYKFDPVTKEYIFVNSFGDYLYLVKEEIKYFNPLAL